MNQATFIALSDFHNWFARGGAQLAGLPVESITPLYDSVQDLRSRARQLAYDLGRLRDDWLRIEQSQSKGLARILLHRVIVGLQSLHLQSNALITQAAKSNAILQEVRELVRLHIKDDQIRIDRANNDLAESRRQQEQARQRLRDAQAQLQGDKGFWNGFLTGITFTAYNPIQENINKANEAIATYNYQVQVSKSQIIALEQSLRELQESGYILDQLQSLDQGLVDYLNFLVKAETSLQEAFEDAERFESAQSERVGAYYQRQAEKEMNELFSWIDAFGSVY
jgi:chromosome segregation ATPase